MELLQVLETFSLSLSGVDPRCSQHGSVGMWCGVIFTRRADGRDISGLIADLSETDASTRLSIIHVKVLGIGLISLLLIFVLFDRSLFRCDHESFKLFWLRHWVVQQPFDADFATTAKRGGGGDATGSGGPHGRPWCVGRPRRTARRRRLARPVGEPVDERRRLVAAKCPPRGVPRHSSSMRVRNPLPPSSTHKR